MYYYTGKEKKLHFSIDRLTIIGGLVSESSFYHILTFLQGIENCFFSSRADSSIFEISCNIEGLGYVQFDRVDKKLRIDFNPNKISLEGKNVLNFLLSFTNNVHYSRLDLAVDLYNYNLYDYNIIDIGNRKSAYYYDRQGKLETLYSGSSKSNKYIRIYNKAVEQKLCGLDWWRFEIQLRDVYINKYLDEVTDFFKDILVYQYNCITEYSVEQNAMVEYLLRDVSRLNLLSKNSVSKYKKIIRNLKVSSLDFFDSVLNLAVDKVTDYLNYISDNKLYPEKLGF